MARMRLWVQWTAKSKVVGLCSTGNTNQAIVMTSYVRNVGPLAPAIYRAPVAQYPNRSVAFSLFFQTHAATIVIWLSSSLALLFLCTSVHTSLYAGCRISRVVLYMQVGVKLWSSGLQTQTQRWRNSIFIILTSWTTVMTYYTCGVW